MNIVNLVLVQLEIKFVIGIIPKITKNEKMYVYKKYYLKGIVILNCVFFIEIYSINTSIRLL